MVAREQNPNVVCGSVLWLVLLLAALLGGCSTPGTIRCDHTANMEPRGKLDFGQFHEIPRPRLGMLPYYGPFTLFEAADPVNLGHHSYTGRRRQGVSPEVERGLIYTCRAGFVDLSHLRKAADQVAHLQPRLELALRYDWPCVEVRSREPSTYHVVFDYPMFWDRLDAAEKQRLSREMSIVLAQRLSFLMLTWHEIITWFGYKATILLPEDASAFSYDDTTSHMLGVLIAGEALRSDDDYDAAVTKLLDRQLHQLGVVSSQQMDEAIRAVEDSWWSGGSPKKRHLDIGLDDDAVTPWIVPGLAFCPDAAPLPLQLPDTQRVAGRRFGRFYHVEINPNILESGALRAVISGADRVIVPRRDFPALMAHIREQVGDENSRP